MKTKIVLILLTAITTAINAQTWSGTTPGNIYYNSGNVGIGTNSPETELDVKLNNSYARVEKGSANIGITNGMFSFRDGMSNLYSHAIWLINTGLNGGVFGGITNSPAYNQSPDFGIHFVPGGTGNWNNWQAKMSINNNGFVGIGTTAPQSSLDINQPDASVRITASNGTASGVGNPSLYINRNASEGLKLEYVPNVLARISNTYVGPLGHLAFATSGQDRLFITGNGNVGIGTTNPGSYKLAVEGKIGAKEIVVTTAGWADYVFENTYSLRPLSEVESYIKENKHLPEIPSTKEVEVNGVNLGEMNVLLLKKVEELTLYLIELKKENIDQRKQNERLQSKIESILQKLNAGE